MKAIKIFIAVICTLQGILVLYGQNDKTVVDTYTFSKTYKTISAIDSIHLIHENYKNQLQSENDKLLENIAYCDAIDLKGEHLKALELMKDLQDEIASSSTPASIAAEYNSILGNISLRNENPELAVDQYYKSIDLINEGFSETHVQSLYMRLSKGLNALGEHEKAMNYLSKAMALETKGTNRNSLYLRLNIALTNSFLGNLDEAKAYFKKALTIIQLESDNFAEVRTLGNLADIYAQQDSFDLSESYYLEGMQLAQQTGMVLDLIRFHESLSKLYAQHQLFETAYSHRIQADSLSNKYNSSQVSENIIALELNHKIEKEKLENQIQSQKLATEKWHNLLLSIFSGVLVLTLIIILTLLFQLKKKNKILLKKTLKTKPREQRETTDQYTELVANLNQLLVDEKIIHDSKLSIELLARKLQTNRTYLSEAINSHYNVSFSKLINELRVESAKEMLINPDFDHLSIEGIANTVGFASISSFNSNFKKSTGLTPSYLRKNRTK
ncbi:helix-turn-helix domain-containing protein [Parvicella tangerina]|uniref:HTH araC/xylS-type domain-containing protein n=1 Tax=Parvicella tangerina TaxID=2829795 RepID=A0A916NPR4_9FLAO|nr:AraC family transcriptional regulator [Parvicella tangerina]CAG5077343.1 hypothetical protein CRYO30217_00356 [Parvicella tangerina]